MAPKTKTTKGDHEIKVKDWAKRLYTAVTSEREYKKLHKGFLDEFQKLRDEARDLDVNKVTMINHAAPIYDHIASQGYEVDVHYAPLREAVSNFCANKPVNNWKGPPDQRSRTSSPFLPSSPPPPPPPRKNRAVIPAMVASGPSGLNKRKTKDEPVRTEHDEDGSGKPRKAADSLPSTEGMEQNPTKCSLCDSRNHGCYVNPNVNPKTNKAAAACFECNHWRLKCSLAATRTKKGEDKGDDEEEVVVLKEPPPKKQRKKPAQVPAGQSGQLGGRLAAFLLTSTDIRTSIHYRLLGP